jgi:SAM-dependent methyltransferase
MDCPACGTDSFRLWREVDSTLSRIPAGLDRQLHVHVHVDRCAVCGLFKTGDNPSVVNQPQPISLSVSFEASASKIPLSGTRPTSSFDELSLLHTKPPATMLDVGCGAGQLLLRAINMGYQAQGLDTDPLAIRFASEHVGLPVRLGSLDALRATESFDVISIIGVLEHIQDPVAFLSQASGHLNPGGEMLIGVPNADSLNRWVSGRSQHDWDMFLEPGHLYHYGHNSLVRVAGRAGLKVLRWNTGTMAIRGKIPFLPHRYARVEAVVRRITRIKPLQAAYLLGLRSLDRFKVGDMLLATLALQDAGDRGNSGEDRG